MFFCNYVVALAVLTMNMNMPGIQSRGLQPSLHSQETFRRINNTRNQNVNILKKKLRTILNINYIKAYKI